MHSAGHAYEAPGLFADDRHCVKALRGVVTISTEQVPMPGLEVVDLGRMAWDAALAVQLMRAEGVARGEPGAVYLVEHEPVITLGRNAGEKHLLASRQDLAAQGVALYRAERGGDITCHFPGQLVVYVVTRLDKRPGGLRRFMADLEGAALHALDELGVIAERDPARPGLWVAGRKIASVGVAVRKWVTMHGLSLNVGRDLGLFERITLCGLSGVAPTSLNIELERHNKPPANMEDVKHVCARRFGQAFAAARVVPGQAAPGT